MNPIHITWSPAEVTAAVDVARAAGPALRAMPAERRAALLCEAAQRLHHAAEGAQVQALREALLQRSGLSAPMIEWGLSSTLGTFQPAPLLGLLRGTSGPPPELVAVVLSGNVFTAPLRGMLLPLLCGAPVVCKASSSDGILAAAFAEELARVDRVLGRAAQVLHFGRDKREAFEALIARAEVVSAYGDDGSLDEIAAALPPGVRLIRHGHGLGAVYVPWQAIRDRREALSVARRVALDVAAYDQRGCLSPHFVLVQAGGAWDANDFASALSRRAFPELQTVLPRGQVPEAVRAEQMQWRGVAEVRGRLRQGDSYAIGYEGRQALRPSPGYRYVGVYECLHVQDLALRLLPFGAHLKAVSVAGPEAIQAEVRAALAPAQQPRVSEVGTIQTPPVDAPADGHHALHGLLQTPD